MRRILAVLAAVVLGLFASAGQASASDPPSSAADAQAQAAAAAQAAMALANGQGQPTSTPNAAPAAAPAAAAAPAPAAAPAAASAPAAAPPAAPGSVGQSNTGLAGSVAANGNSTGQTSNQAQSGGSGTQAAGQIAGNQQSATSNADAQQSGATNQNVDVRIFSPGSSGSVNQSNTVIAGSLAANGNKTDQSSTQTQGGGPGSGGTQAVGQAAASKQDATSDATASQHGAKNTNISVRIFSEGDDGDVKQSNTVAGISAALNGNKTDQSATQNQSGPGGGTQGVLQGAASKQDASSSADASQRGASNENIGVRIFSPGKNGSVEQSNTVLAGSLAANGNKTTQDAEQTQGGGYGGSNKQVIGQGAANDQYADSSADADQHGAKNVNVPVRIFSEGDDGNVKQSNTVVGLAAALNGNKTDQTASQTQGGPAPMPMPIPVLDPYGAPDKHAPAPKPGSGVQAIGQIAESKQDADAGSSASQEYVSNVSVPVRIGSPGAGGSTTQANTVIAGSLALNGNKTTQSGDQTQAGPGTLVQGLGQIAKSKQDAKACADASQKDAKNVNAPLRLFSEGSDGSTLQSNAAVALAAALNVNVTGQSSDQSQSGGPGSTLVQGVGQASLNDQNAMGNATTNQHGVSNLNNPLRIDIPKLDKKPEPCKPSKPDGEECGAPSKEPKCAPRKPIMRPCEPCKPQPKCPVDLRRDHLH